MRALLLSLVLSLVPCAVFFFSVSNAEARDRCLPVRGKLRATFGPCPADFSSPIGLCSSGTLQGFPSGNTRFRATNAAYSAGLPDTEAPTTLSYTGELELRDRHGKILFMDVGLNDSQNGIFTELSRVWSATGAYNGHYGALFITGHATNGGLSFEGEVRGKLCR